jgi:uncharacterized membrane protein (DUF441 family)
MNDTTSETTSDTTSAARAAQVKSLGFWNRLTAAIVSASAVGLVLLSAVFGLILIGNPSHQGFYVDWIRSYGLYVGIITVAVLALGYPVERFWVGPNDTRLKAATKQTAGVVAVLIVYLVAQFGVNLISQQPPITFAFEAWMIAISAVTAGITAFAGRLLYPTLVKHKQLMYVAGAILGLLALYPLVNPY